MPGRCATDPLTRPGSVILASLRCGALRGLKGGLDECAVFYLMYLCIFTCSFRFGISVSSVHIVFL